MMTTEPFSPSSNRALNQGSAPIVPVTPEMMDHAAHAAAERADAVAHEVSEAAREAHHDAPDTEPGHAEPAPEVEASRTSAALATADAASASEAVATAASSATLQAADLGVLPGRDAAQRTVESANRAAAGPTDSFGRYNAKILEIAAANLSAAGDLVSALLDATSISEAAAINAEHTRRRLDVLTTQGRDLMLLAQGLAFDAMRSSGDDPRKA